jgi:hypothetical protein
LRSQSPLPSRATWSAYSRAERAGTPPSQSFAALSTVQRFGLVADFLRTAEQTWTDVAHCFAFDPCQRAARRPQDSEPTLVRSEQRAYPRVYGRGTRSCRRVDHGSTGGRVTRRQRGGGSGSSLTAGPAPYVRNRGRYYFRQHQVEVIANARAAPRHSRLPIGNSFHAAPGAGMT